MLNKQLTKDGYKRLRKLLPLCTEQNFFKFDDLLVIGISADVIKDYLNQNPSKKFRTWLIDNGYSVKITVEK